jgi:RimJ/RimL family protein N-acetyltransferase
MPLSALLRDGRVAPIRALREGGAPGVEAFVHGLSPQARYARFLAPVRELTPQRMRVLLTAPGLCLAAFTADGRIVAHAQYALEGQEAEFGLVVAEDWRRISLGEQLLMLLKQHAIGAGARVLGALMLADNLPMRRLAEKLGLRVRIAW